MRKAVEASPSGAVYAKFNGVVQSDVPIYIQLEGKDNVPVCLEENAVFDKVVFRGSVAGNASALVRKTEQRADIHLKLSNSGKIFFPRWATFELDTVAEREDVVGSMLTSAIAGFFGLRYPYMEIHRRNVLRNETRMFVAGDVTLDDDKLVITRPAASLLNPRPVLITRSRESEIIEGYRKKEQWLNIFSGFTGAAGVGLILAHMLKNGSQ